MDGSRIEFSRDFPGENLAWENFYEWNYFRVSNGVSLWWKTL